MLKNPHLPSAIPGHASIHHIQLYNDVGVAQDHWPPQNGPTCTNTNLLTKIYQTLQSCAP